MEYATRKHGVTSAMVAKAIVAMCVVNLAGCTDSDISKVKEMKFEPDPSYTVGQAFDHRSVCDAVTWDTIKDERGRKIVEYRCSFKGVKDYIQSTEEAHLKEMNSNAQVLKNAYLVNIKTLQDNLAQRQKTLADDQARLVQTDAGASNQQDQEVQKLNDQIAVLQSGDIDKIASTPLDPSASLGIAASCYTDPQQNPAVKKHCGDVLRQEIPRAIGALKQQLSYDMATRQRNQADLQAGLKISMNVENQQISEYQQKLGKMTSGKDAYFASIDNELKQQSTHPNPIVEVDEVFQWSVGDSGDFVLVYAGTEAKHQDGTAKDQAYGDAEAALVLIAKNNATTFVQYLQQFSAQSVMDFVRN
ncbi:hypothetical protein [Dyella caseinilytica]|uniref:Uncharacterized protein n=1 Tax=Dyella caseinilytica TaxID=1849581 RepID=A0ABX7GPB9_9GAMM|nr:hypothetical protein [Dyella caseinilytica]QRN52252.1 hypothetical protein ISN74_12205 [Dyella caseinilytica]